MIDPAVDTIHTAAIVAIMDGLFEPASVQKSASRCPLMGAAVLIHCVTLKFKDSASSSDIEAFRDALAALPDQVDFLIRTRQGADLGERPTNADYAVVTEFDNADDFSKYLTHPAHLAVPRGHVESMHSVQFVLDEQY